MRRLIDRAEKEQNELPVLDREKLGANIVYKPSEDWDDTTKEHNWLYSPEKIRLIQEFIKKHDYKIVWENELFQIYLPGNNQGGNVY
jgi:hypothetical protein